MLIFRIIVAVILLISVFVLPWWLLAFLFLLGVFTFPFFYEVIFIALIADLFYDHIFFGRFFIPIFAIVMALVMFVFERFRRFVL